MPEKDSTRQLRELQRYTWEIVRKGVVLEQFHQDILPETYSVDEPARVTITQTRGTGYVDMFGFGYGQLTISGTTGFTTRSNPNKGSISADLADGFERWQAFRDFFKRFFNYTIAAPGDQYYMHFLNWTQDDYFIVFPSGKPVLQRNVQQSLLYRYSLTVTLIDRLQRTPYVQDQRDKTIEELATQGPKRVGVIGAAIDTNLENLWEQFVTNVQNSSSLPTIDNVTKDANVQSYLDKVLARNKPANYIVPTDSGSPLSTRTRTLSEKIVDFTNQKTSFIDTTIQEVHSVANFWRDVLDASEYSISVPASFSRQIRETLCSVQSLLLYPQLFRTSAQQTLTDITGLLTPSGCATTLNF